MKEYQKRVLDEADELQDKVNKLTLFLNKVDINESSFDNEQYDLLVLQRHYMDKYLSILKQRIDLF